MKIGEYLTPDNIIASLAGGEKDAVLEELCRMLKIDGVAEDRILQVILDRESLGSTGIGDGVAIPHGKLRGADRMHIVFGRSAEGVEFNSIDGKPAHLFFLLIAPEDNTSIHLKALARLSKMLKNPSFRKELISTADADAIANLIVEEEKKLD